MVTAFHPVPDAPIAKINYSKRWKMRVNPKQMQAVLFITQPLRLLMTDKITANCATNKAGKGSCRGINIEASVRLISNLQNKFNGA